MQKQSFVKRDGTPIVPVTKFPFHRSGPDKEQDWYHSLVKAEEILNDYLAKRKEAFILILSDVQADGCPHEGETYYKALIKRGVAERDIQFVKEGQETVGQLKWIKKHYGDRKPVLISVTLHAPRVKYICWSLELKATHYVVAGKKRMKEAITDVILIFAFPIIDLLGLTSWFQKKVVGRRESGKH